MKAFQCSHSGCLFPADYIKEWGRKYGVSMGPEPVSMVYDSCYGVEPSIPGTTRQRRGNSPITHPVKVCGAQVDLVEVTPEDFEKRKALAPDDPELLRVILNKQRKNPRANVLIRKGV